MRKDRKDVDRVRKMVAAAMAAVMTLSLCFGQAVPAKADTAQVKPYISFGADLTTSQKNKVMELLGVSQDELADYEVLEITNQDEHDYLDSYLDSSVIGSKALSSVKIEEADAGSGISVETHNISFCTSEMYSNALATAGVSDATVTVAGPFQLSGTAALVGAMKAYGAMTGDTVDQESADAATNELVVTGELGESIGKEEAAQLVALVKNKVLSGDLSSDAQIEKAIEDAAKELGITITDGEKASLLSLMKKIAGLDLDWGKVKNQAKGIYDKLQGMNIDTEQAKSFLAKVASFFSSLLDKLAQMFQ